MGVAFVLAFETKGLLLGEGVDPETLADIRKRVLGDPAVEGVGDILTMYIGPYALLVNLGVQFRSGSTTEEIHDAIGRIETDLMGAYPACTRIYIEAESLRPALTTAETSS
jgi:divalent metal cation (Fe/Co/Zn/Cd) transporter